MVAFARNLSGNTKIRAAKQVSNSKPRKTLKEHASARLDRGVRVPTRELKVHIAILEIWLSNPAENIKLSENEKKGMTGRLKFYQAELAQRDERDNRPLSAQDLAAKLSQSASRGTQNGIRIQLHA